MSKCLRQKPTNYTADHRAYTRSNWPSNGSTHHGASRSASDDGGSSPHWPCSLRRQGKHNYGSYEDTDYSSYNYYACPYGSDSRAFRNHRSEEN